MTSASADIAMATAQTPALLDADFVTPLVTTAIEHRNAGPLMELLLTTIRHEIGERVEHVWQLRSAADGSLEKERACVDAEMALKRWARRLYVAATTGCDVDTEPYDSVANGGSRERRISCRRST